MDEESVETVSPLLTERTKSEQKTWVYSSPRIFPFSSKKTRRSTSGSTATPKSALVIVISSLNPLRFSDSGSGVWLKTPSISAFIILYLIFNFLKSIGNAIEPVELIASATTNRFSSFIFLSGKISRLIIPSIWSSIRLVYLVISPKDSFAMKLWSLDSEYSISFSTSSFDKNSPSELKNFNPLYSSGLWLAVIINPATDSLFRTPQHKVGVVESPVSITLIPIEAKTEFTRVCINSPDFLPSLPVITVKLDEVGLFSFINLEKAAIDETISIGVKLSFFWPPIVPRKPDIFFIKVIWNVNI